MDSLNDQIRLHSAGAIIRHKTSFDNLVSYKNDFELSQEFIDNWAVPFYMNIGDTDREWRDKILDIKDNITKEIVAKLLGDFNWRTRQTGAFFAAVKNYTEFIDIIGIHLLKSEVTYAGQVYACVLAYFNTEKSIVYLNDYLTYYLDKTELWFDQSAVMEALKYVDEKRESNLLSVHLNSWLKFIEHKP
ncbi:MAG: hypothetical protein EOO43_08945 [Flavobacterium sp.]|nr:MAG: hypothetical protein EOO43_08945 [Flavobacterium sp.]